MRLKVSIFSECDQGMKKYIAEKLYQYWADVYIKLYNIKSIDELISYLDNQECFVFIRNDNNEFVGTFTITINKKNYKHGAQLSEPIHDYWLSNFYVDEKYRGKQIGTYILKYMEDYLYQIGANSISLICDGNVCTFYKRNGYKMIGFVNENKQSYIMIKPLLS